MFLTVGIAVYNAEIYLDKCIESVLTQTETDYEVILVDDGSTDNSVKICKKWEKLYPDKIRVLFTEHQGSLLARRKCLLESRGQYIYLVDADDYLLDCKMFEKVKHLIQETGSDFCFFNATSEVSNRPYFKFDFKNHEIFENGKLEQIYKMFCEDDTFNCLWNKIFSRELVDWDKDYGKYLNFTNSTDMFQLIPIVMNAKKIVYLEETLYFYRTDNLKSIVHVFSPNTYQSLRKSFIRLDDAMKNIYFENKEKILSNRFMRFVSTAIYKTRFMSGKDDFMKYIREMGEDELFRTKYNTATLILLPKTRLALVALLYKRRYKTLWSIMCIFNADLLKQWKSK